MTEFKITFMLAYTLRLVMEIAKSVLAISQRTGYKRNIFPKRNHQAFIMK